MICEIYLPFPPTVNNYYSRSKHAGVFISQKGRKYRAQVEEAVVQQCPGLHITDRMLVEVVLFPPDKRVRDVDNYNKSLLDALSHAGLWEDDQLIDQLFMYRGEVRSRRGIAYIRVSEAGPVIKEVGMLPDS